MDHKRVLRVPMALLCGGLVLALGPAAAEAGKLGRVLGGIGAAVVIGKIVGGNSGKVSGGQKSSKKRGGGSSGSDSEESSSASKASSSPSESAEAAAQRKEAEEAQRLAKKEDDDRNVDAAILDFVSSLRDWHKALLALKELDKTNAGAQTLVLTDVNQVTEAEIRPAVENAFKTANLQQFASLDGAYWTHDRLIVRMLRRGSAGLEPFFQGVGAKGPSMKDIETVLNEAGTYVYRLAIETNEILGTSTSYDRLVRRLYENSEQQGQVMPVSAMLDSGGNARIETMVQHIMTETGLTAADLGAADFDKGAFASRYRVRRMIYDCLASGLGALNKGAVQDAQGQGGEAVSAQGGVVNAGLDLGAGQLIWTAAESQVKSACLSQIEGVKSASLEPVSLSFNFFGKPGAVEADETAGSTAPAGGTSDAAADAGSGDPLSPELGNLLETSTPEPSGSSN